jgi:hypothetical protein
VTGSQPYLTTAPRLSSATSCLITMNHGFGWVVSVVAWLSCHIGLKSAMLGHATARWPPLDFGCMEATLRVLNDLERSGVIGRYAIRGAMAATFYAEPLLTFDLDVFVVLPQTQGGLLTLQPLYEALRRRGYREAEESVEIEGVAVQFVPAYNALIEEALMAARDVLYERTPSRVLRVEHLLAVAVQTGRDKDRDRVRLLRGQATIDQAFLDIVFERHGLEEKWKQWTREMLS